MSDVSFSDSLNKFKESFLWAAAQGYLIININITCVFPNSTDNLEAIPRTVKAY